MNINLPKGIKNFSAKFSLFKFFQRDKDITYYDEFHYIYITLRELIEVIKTKNK